jgi:putative aminopeptidase FrvX
MRQLLRSLTDTFSPSGSEDALRQVILAEIESLADDIRVDVLGNLIVHKGVLGKNGKRIMVAAHMDEVGLIATHVDRNGFVRFTTLGTPLRRFMPGGRVRFVNGVQGLIGWEPSDRTNEISQVAELFIDVGANSPADCPIRAGDVAGFDRSFMELGKRLVARSMDDRAGVLVAIETMRRLTRQPAGGPGSGPNEIFFVFTVQEQVGVRGAPVSAYGIDPEIGLLIDVTPTGDTPEAVKRDLILGKGPAIKVKDASMLADPHVVNWMTRTAQKNKLPFQREILPGGNLDVSAIQMVRSGVRTGGLGIPCRYLYSQSEMVDIEDLENAIKLLTAMLSKPVEMG